MLKPKTPQYAIEFRTDEAKFREAEEFVRRFARSQGRGETSNYDRCYFLDDEQVDRVKFVKVNQDIYPKVILLTNTVDREVFDGLRKILCSEPSKN